MDVEPIDIERIVREIRGAEPAIPPARETPPPGASPALQTAVDELRSCCDLYASHGLPPTRVPLPRALRPFLARVFRYVSNWQVHWNLVASRAFGEVVAALAALEHWVSRALAARDERHEAWQRRLVAVEVASPQLEERLRRFETAQEALGESVRELRLSADDLRDELRELRSIVERASGAHDPEQQRLLDRAYLRLEQELRGDEAEIRRRQEVYLPIFRAALDAGTDEAMVLDLGCGRGEMLELFREAGIPARGVDGNEAMIALCREKALDVVHADFLTHLESLPAGSLAGVIACQVIEHLDTDPLVRLLQLAFDRLRRGGRMVLETVNPANLLVGAYTFHLDPSHRTKIPAITLVHLARSVGFHVDETLYLSPCPAEQRLGTVAEVDENARTVHQNFERLNELLFGFRDYAVVCSKTAEAPPEAMP
jgi:SAM-dependent methyltransferase